MDLGKETSRQVRPRGSEAVNQLNFALERGVVGQLSSDRSAGQLRAIDKF
jgi:hypothetical protein